MTASSPVSGLLSSPGTAPSPGTAREPSPAPLTLPVDEITVRVLAVPLRERVPMSFSSLTARRTVLVTLRSGDLYGTGESWVNHPDWGWRERLATLDGIRPHVLGADAADPPALMTDLAARLHGVARQWGAPGPLWQALSGIDMAAWDLLGQARRAPLATLLAERAGHRGPLPAAVPAYGSGVGPTDVTRLTERALEQGLGAVKIKVGFGEETDLATVREVRAVAGPDLPVFADANQAWDLPTAERMCGLLGAFGIEWFEEPLAEDRPAELAELARRTGVRLAGGENVYGAEACAGYAALPGLAHFQPDPAKTAGVSMSDTAGRRPGTARLSPHCYSAAPGLASGVQLVAAAPRPGLVELDLRPNPLRTGIATGPRLTSGGTLTVPAGPGLGLDYDPGAVDRFTTYRTTSTETEPLPC
ncbi:mandelate racemase/muconate lactonizing enzyme family protein [Streptomyces lycii]|uniref:Mandelate racemase/muconate lactonizing enzyme family protein n=1 Tax=Streptomyces lycii TaxID=2654337 RepID=A0ABQ7FI28_9ACTN|nr:mandelate racemase/muconate lactonizing enzyme family protein [Streptomyces lycii]KAF4408480.1 mandelate racemase/muconate lactonizing enzyme family protein [Streptomyces lycii]